MLRIGGGARVLYGADGAAVAQVLGRDPVEAVLVATRFERGGLSARSLGGRMWGYGGASLESVCLSGANLVPVQAGRAAVKAFAERAMIEGRRCSSIVGRADAVHDLWDLLEPEWGVARAVRRSQPMMVIDHQPVIAPDPLVRRLVASDADTVYPACVAMFTEEIGVSPLLYDGGRAYRNRVNELISEGRSFARIEDGAVVFKAELGAVSRDVAQVQGVWVNPAMRGRNLAAAGMAAVVQLAFALGVRAVSLYVNDFNVAARRAYTRVGFREAGEFATVLF